MAKDIKVSIEFKASRRKAELRMSQFLKSEYLAFHELGTEQIRLVLRAALPIHTYMLKDSRTRELFFHLFHNQNFLITPLKSVLLLQLVLDNSQAKAQLSYEMSAPIVFDAQLYYYVAALMSRKVERKNRNIFRNVLNSTMAAMAGQLVRKALDALKWSCSLG